MLGNPNLIVYLNNYWCSKFKNMQVSSNTENEFYWCINSDFSYKENTVHGSGKQPIKVSNENF